MKVSLSLSAFFILATYSQINCSSASESSQLKAKVHDHCNSLIADKNEIKLDHEYTAESVLSVAMKEGHEEIVEFLHEQAKSKK